MNWVIAGARDNCHLIFIVVQYLPLELRVIFLLGKKRQQCNRNLIWLIHPVFCYRSWGIGLCPLWRRLSCFFHWAAIPENNVRFDLAGWGVNVISGDITWDASWTWRHWFLFLLCDTSVATFKQCMSKNINE